MTTKALNFIPEAPSDGKQYARKNKGWVEVQGGGAERVVRYLNSLEDIETSPEVFSNLYSAFSQGKTAVLIYGEATLTTYQAVAVDIIDDVRESITFFSYDSSLVLIYDMMEAVYSGRIFKFTAEAPYDGKQYARKNGGWAEVQGGGEAVQADWNETDSEDPAFIKNKPTIPTVNNPTVTIKQGGTTKGTFTLNQGSAATIDLDADTGTILIDTMSMMDEGGTISWSDMEDYGLSRSAYDGLPSGAIVTCTVQANKSLPIEYAPMSIRKLDANTGKAFAFAFLKNGSSMIAARCTITFEPVVVTAEFDTRILS